MADIETTTVNEDEYHALSRVGEFELSIDATGSEGPEQNEVLVASYASCYAFACRAGADRQLDVDLGKVEIEAEAELDEDDHLEAIRFHMKIEVDLDDEELEEVLALGDELCHVRAAIKEELYADVEVTTDAF